jgi:hypothetical protein
MSSSSLFHFTRVYQIKNPVDVLHVWASAHVDQKDTGAVVCVMAKENEKLVLIDLVVDSGTLHGTLEGLGGLIREVLGLLFAHPCYQKSSVRIYMDANPLAFVQTQQIAIQGYCELPGVSWECRAANMPNQPGVSVNAQMKRTAWAAFTTFITENKGLYRVCPAMRLHRIGKVNPMDALLKGMEMTHTSKPSNVMVDLAILLQMMMG